VPRCGGRNIVAIPPVDVLGKYHNDKYKRQGRKPKPPPIDS
jgi:hypothetical protein